VDVPVRADGAADVDVVVLAGGRSSRFGADKLALLLDSVLDGLPAQACVVCVGPPRATRREGVLWVREEPAFGGPLAGVAAGMVVGSAPVVVVAGGDMPGVGLAVQGLLAALGEAPGTHDGAVLVDARGRPQLLASAWHRDRLTEVLAHIGANSDDSFDLAPTIVTPGRPLRLLLDGTDLLRVPDAWGAAHDVDTTADLR